MIDSSFSRRQFLNTAVTVSGGLVLALTLPARAGKSPAGSKDVQLNAWLKIAPDNSITFIVDRSEMGQGVYTALPMLLAEELHVDLDAVKLVAAPVGDAYVSPGNGGQVTGTSNSVQESWEKLRTAGAQARTMLIQAAAARWKVKPDECRAEAGQIHNMRGESLTYGAVAEAAGKLPVPKEVPLKPKSQFTLVGKSRLRTDTPSKVDGSAEFGIDVRLPGMLYAAIAMCPVLGGKVASFDGAQAEKMPGVRRVLKTDSGVVVVAEHYWQALKARDALKINWQPGENEHLDNASMWALLKKAAREVPALSARADGDAAKALKGAARTLEASYELPLLAHATMEPMNCTADVRADRCDLYVGTQVQQVAQMTAAENAQLKPEQVNVHTTLLGGGFGRRLDVDFIPAAVQASKAVGVPVQLIWTREDDLTHDTFRPPALEDMQGAIDANGKLTAVTLHVTSPSITARMFPPVKGVDDSVVEYAINFAYEVPSYSLTYSRQEIGIDVGYMRSVSHAPNCFAIESFMDELAALSKKDPLQYRLDLFKTKARNSRVLQVAAERGNWGKAPAGRFQGVAYMLGYTTHVAQIVEISVQGAELKVHKITCVIDCGQMVHPKIVESQIESGIVFGLSAALWGDITLIGGRAQQTNFNNYRLLRAHEMPQVEVHLLESEEAPGGIGEAAVACVAPALTNAVFAATGKRLRRLPVLSQGSLKLA